MDSRFLETFIEVVRRGSIAAAARQLGLTSGAVAQRIQALEAEIGTDLLIRAGRTVQPTEAGRVVHDGGERVLREIRSMKGLALADGLTGELKLGAIATAMTGLMPSALRWLKAEAPNVEVFLLPGTSSALLQQLTDGEIDVALLLRPPFALAKEYEWHPVRTEPLRLICPAHVPDMRAEEIFSFLHSMPFIRYDRNNWGGRSVELWMRRHGFSPREWLELDSLDAIAVMVNAGLGVAIVPEWSRPWPEGLNIRVMPLPDDAPSREIGVLWSRGTGRTKLIEALISALSGGLQQDGGRSGRR